MGGRTETQRIADGLPAVEIDCIVFYALDFESWLGESLVFEVEDEGVKAGASPDGAFTPKNSSGVPLSDRIPGIAARFFPSNFLPLTSSESTIRGFVSPMGP